MENQTQNVDISPVHDIKQVCKKTIQCIFLSLCIGAVILPVRLFYNQNISAALLAVFCAFLSTILLLNKKGYTKYVQPVALVGINLFLLGFSFVGTFPSSVISLPLFKKRKQTIKNK